MRRVLKFLLRFEWAELASYCAWCIAVGFGGVATFGAVRHHEGWVFVELMAALTVVAAALLSSQALRDLALPVAQPLGAVAGGLLGIQFSLGVANERFLGDPSLGELAVGLLGLTTALVVAHIRISRERYRAEQVRAEQLERLEQMQRQALKLRRRRRRAAQAPGDRRRTRA